MQHFWQGVGDQPTATPLRRLKVCRLLGPEFGSQAFFSAEWQTSVEQLSF